MCGITGWVSRERPMDRRAFDRMTDSLAHRGPDGRGTWYDRDDRIALGHRRLAIVDLSPLGAQPMLLPEAGLALTYNGEIYNHPELRAELEARGHVYRSRCDTETILHAYREWGPACVERFRGIFAFALWDAQAGRLFAARDHLGVKPFYWCEAGSGLAFASQPRAFLDLPGFTPEIAPDGFLDALTYGIVPGDRGAWRGVGKLPPGHTLTWEGGEVRTRAYWTLPEAADIRDPDEAVRALDEALDRVVGMQLMSDVPVASFLSGGIDSSLVSAIAASQRTGERLTTFTVGFEEAAFDERPYARIAAEHCGAEPVVDVLRAADLDATIDGVVEAYDEPFGIDAALPMVAISRLVAAHGVKVVLTGDGADELFAGYRHYDALAGHYRRYGRTEAARVANRPRDAFARIVWGRFDPFTVYGAHNATISGAVGLALAGPALAQCRAERWREARHFRTDLGAVEAARRCDLVTYLPDEILVKVDRATMAYGIEARVPFLDPAIVELAFRIEPSLHYLGGERKALLKRAARRWLPETILTGRKRGFSPPLQDWLGETGRQRAMLETVQGGRLVAEGYLRSQGLAEALSRLRRPAAALFQIYLLERWAQRWASPAASAHRPADLRLAST